MKLITIILSVLCFAISVDTCLAQTSKKKLARVKRNADGTITELEEKDARTIVRRTLREKANKERIVASKSTYMMDGHRVLRQCRIADGQGKLLFIVRYGYHERTGRLIAEAMFDAQAQNLNHQGKEIPVQRLYYKYDAHGNRSKPFAITSVGNKKVEEVTDWNDHIKERLEKINANFGEGPTILSEEERKLLEANEQLNR